MAPDKKKIRKKLVGLVALCIGFRHMAKRRRIRESHSWAELYDELALICRNDHATGAFARSIEQSSGTATLRHQVSFGGPSPPFNEYMENSQDSPNPPPSASTSRTRRSGSKRSRSSDNEGSVDPVAASLAHVADSLVEPEWLERLYTKLHEMQEFPQALLEKAFDYLCAHRLEGVKFMVRNHEARYDWLELFARDNPM